MALPPMAHGIVDVAPLRLHPDLTTGQWSCSECGRMHPRGTSWVLTYRRDRGGDLRFVVCEPCGLERQPLRVVIDLAAMEHELPSDDPLIEHVAYVRTVRREDIGQTLQIRDADLSPIAASAGTDVRGLVVSWERAGFATRTLVGLGG